MTTSRSNKPHSIKRKPAIQRQRGMAEAEAEQRARKRYRPDYMRLVEKYDLKRT